jgi:nitrite reductase/ring-hydroxylating ferredoxin subunit
MDFVKVGDLKEILDGKRVVTEISDQEVLVLAMNDRVFAICNLCSHEEVWMDDGDLYPESWEIECPMHEGRFDVRTGAATHEPCTEPVATYEVKIDGDDVLVGVE